MFQNCAYEDCLSAFSHGAELDSDSELLLTKAKCHFLLGEDEQAIPLFKRYCETSYATDYKSDVTMMEICKNIRKGTDSEIHVSNIEDLEKMLSMKTEEDCKIFKLRDMHQLKGSIYLLLGEYQVAAREF